MTGARNCIRAMHETGLTFSADAIAQAEVASVNNELQITAPKQFQLDLGSEEIRTALKHLGFPALRFKVTGRTMRSAAAPVEKPRRSPRRRKMK